ncbi:chloride channel protein [Streptomyces parvus]|uniref:chloride channel protein n=1 Tax=Streptomyces parvus TaxID=66428 RepID=UPI0036407E49
MPTTPPATPATAPEDPYAAVRTRKYAVLLLMAAVVGGPVSAVAFGFLALVSELQSLTYTELPKALGFEATPSWWPVPLLGVAGLLVGLVVRRLPGGGGHRPAEGLVSTGPPPAADLPGIVLAALVSLGVGAVLGPEAPLIALGGGLALVLGVAAAFAGAGIRRLSLALQDRVARRTVVGTAVMGLVVGALALVYAETSGKDGSEVLYSGEHELGHLLSASAGYSVGALVLLIVCKSLAYCASLSCFRGGPVFPAMFVGAVGGVALSHLPGLPLTAGFAMGVGAMCVAMLRLPMTSVLLATLLLGKEGFTVMPLAIVAVVVAYVITVRLTPAPAEPDGARTGAP